MFTRGLTVLKRILQVVSTGLILILVKSNLHLIMTYSSVEENESLAKNLDLWAISTRHNQSRVVSTCIDVQTTSVVF